MSIFDTLDLDAKLGADGEKPADIPPDDRADEETKDTPLDTKQNEEKADTKPDDQASSSDVPSDDTKPDAEDASKDTEKAEDTSTEDTKGDDKKSEPSLTPFHEHPDWKKMQDRLKLAEERAEQAERKATEAQAATRANPEYQGLSAAQIATKEVEKKAAGGWKPKDQLEVSEAYATALEKAQEYVASQKKSQEDVAAQSTTAVQKQVDAKFEELGIADEADRKKVQNLVIGWGNSGAHITLDTFDVAAQQLRIKGEIGQKLPDKPTQTDTSKQTEKKTQEEKADANRKLSKKKPDGDGASKSKVNYGYLHSNDLTGIVQDLAEKMG